ncbi:N-terminal EF-hand calcium-binding protein 1 [Sinocyclocheilus grahami]|uniref:N-terminal EF-hand calcium-binding protein 1 n=1 Tax=Sinocyclocheilus grahami TaxID=75366 RepID=UPI0007AC56F8|nr:PREDICTED: N-terminal EF-hand calcium-binding protein 1-like [Sinocyclocheilus grahami]
MLACTEMITMCLQSAKREHLRSKQQQHQHQMQDAVHGLSIFHDIFRRADKNDDGKLSFEEFKAYFADGILTTDELRELFYSIDGRQTNNLDTDKLSDYFSQHLGEYLDVLSALEKLNVAVLKAMDKTKEEYQGSSVLGQFVTRFMLRETSSQLLSLQMSLQCAMEAVEVQSSTTPVEVKVPEHLVIQKNNRRCGRRVQKNMCLSPTDPYSGILTTGNTHTHTHTHSHSLLDISSNLSHVSIQKLPEKSCYIIYEFWQDRISWMSYLQSDASKMFQRCIIDMQEDPEIISTMLMPASWWIMTNN